jgi:hypothetical protein
VVLGLARVEVVEVGCRKREHGVDEVCVLAGLFRGGKTSFQFCVTMSTYYDCVCMGWRVEGDCSTYLKSKLQHPRPHDLERQRGDAVPLKVVQQLHVQQIDGTTLGLG